MSGDRFGEIVKHGPVWIYVLMDRTGNGFTECPDCGDAGTAIGPNGYYECTRFLTCWTDTTDWEIS